MNKKKIAVITGGSYLNRKGFFNAMLNRTKHLNNLNQFNIDVYQYVTYETWLVRKLRHTKKIDKPKVVNVDGVDINLIWRPFTLIDYILNSKLNRKTIISDYVLSKAHKLLKDYDLIEAHTFGCGLIALNAKNEFNIPFVITWHGTDIHTNPFINEYKKHKTASIIENADMNFFVSRALLETSKQITPKGHKMVLYNGRDERFSCYDETKRKEIRSRYAADNKVVAFVGNFREVKNVLVIPEIFRIIKKKRPNTTFWMIGGGKLKKQVENLSSDLNVVFGGDQEPEDMPDFMNAIDVLILPSINEGLPLTLVEALVSGANCVGSRVGGIAEVIGLENTIPLNSPSFANDFAERVLHFLNSEEKIIMPPVFDWNITAETELEALNHIFVNG